MYPAGGLERGHLFSSLDEYYIWFLVNSQRTTIIGSGLPMPVRSMKSPHVLLAQVSTKFAPRSGETHARMAEQRLSGQSTLKIRGT
jgi:hypothetical protein